MGSTAILLLIAVLLCFVAATVSVQNLKTFTAAYGPFNASYYDVLGVVPPATISNDALQMTGYSALPIRSNFLNQPIGPLQDLSGKISLKQPFKLWHSFNRSTDVRVASFNSSFLINIYRVTNTTPGEGLAFVLAPDLDVPSNSFGQFLGLTNYYSDGLPKNRLLAVEFDTFKEDFDPDSNHVGLNINSIISNVTTSLTPLGIEIAPEGGEARFHNVWVQYDGVNKVIEVFIERQAEKDGETPPRPVKPVLRADLDLRDVVDQHSYFGFSASTGKNVQVNSILRWNLTVEYYSDDSPLSKKIIFKVGMGVGMPLLVMGAVVIIGSYYCLRKKRSMARFKSSSIPGALKRLPGTPREFRFNDLKKATNNFDAKNKLGQGGYGTVYKGYLQNENLEVAVKWFSRETIKGQDDFLAELTIINRLRHKHLVPLLGWCHKKGKLLLVYDYMPNGSLDKHLFAKSSNSEPLSWDLRYKIISGVSLALHYLHNDYDKKVVHRDLKASNIMLDSEFNARLGDFGLARAIDHGKNSYTAEGMAGTRGYIAPECFPTGKATQQSDVYAFGAVLLEIVCGRRPGTSIDEFESLVDWVWSLHRKGRLLDAVEERLGREYVEEKAEKVLLLALACSHPIACERPRTQAIVQILSGLVPVPCVPPFKPAFVWPSMPPVGEDDISGLGNYTTETSSFLTAHSGSG